MKIRPQDGISNDAYPNFANSGRTMIKTVYYIVDEEMGPEKSHELCKTKKYGSSDLSASISSHNDKRNWTLLMVPRRKNLTSDKC